MKKYLLFLVAVSSLFSQEIDIDKLLKKYASASELYHKTVKENAGHLIIYSREDLDKMQAYTLNDILKTVRFFTLMTDKRGSLTPVFAGAASSYNQPIKVYIDTYQISSVTFGNVLEKYGKINLYFVDHVEIYLSGSSASFGDEPGCIVIKLYTKRPERENGTFLQTYFTNKKGNSLNILSAYSLNDNYSFLINVNKIEDRFKTLHSSIGDLKRDDKRKSFFLTFSKKDDFNIKSEFLADRYDMFKTFLKKPDNPTGKNRSFYINVDKKLKNNLQLNLYFSKENNRFNLKSKEKFRLSNAEEVFNLKEELESKVYHIGLKKDFFYKNGHFIGRVEYKRYSTRYLEYSSGEKELIPVDGPKKINIYMASFHNDYDLTENDRIVFGFGINRYKHKMDTHDTDFFRAGYIKNYKNIDFKFFGTKKRIFPSFKELTYSTIIKPNGKLSPYNMKSLSAELVYMDESFKINFGCSKEWIKNKVVVENKRFVNDSSTYSNFGAYGRFEYLKDDEKFIFELYKNFEKSMRNSPYYGALIEYFKSIGKFDIYNGLIFRSDFKDKYGNKISKGYNFNVAVTYHISKKLDIKLKGENIFNKATKIYIADKKISTLPQRFLLGFDYTF